MTKLLLVAVVSAALACGGGSKSVKSDADDTPSWVAQGTGEQNAESGKKVQGVGSATGTDQKARRQQADAAAQTQLDGVVTTLSISLTKMSEATQDNLGDAISGIARKAAAQSEQIRDHWVTSDGTEMTLVVLDLSAFKAALGTVDGDDKLKKEMTSNADKAFDQLGKQ